ncbi:MAG: thioredoxin family protein [Ignavibacteria bacterium]|jgi:peroxiredoxin
MYRKSLIIIFTSILFTVIGIYAFDNPSPKNPGDQVEDFTLNNYDGTPYTLSDLKNSKAVVVMFLSTRCPNVQPYTDRLANLYQEFTKEGITFIGINSNSTESLQEVREHAMKTGYQFPVLKDLNNKVADLFGATRTPEVFVLDPNRVVLYHGRIDDNRDAEQVTSNDLRNALGELTAEKDISVKSTKSFGCSIKRVNDSK